MIFTPTIVPGVVALDMERRADFRGYFARIWCADELRAAGISSAVAQINVGFSSRKGTLRGIHFQRAPHAEAKIVRCTRGAVYDVAVDLRSDSPTYLKWIGLELSEANGRALCIPEGCGHGYLTLVDDSEILYTASVAYHGLSAAGVRFDDPRLAIEWPEAPVVVSDADRGWPLLAQSE